MKQAIEYILCYGTAFGLGLLVGVVVTYWIQSDIHQDDVA